MEMAVMYQWLTAESAENAERIEGTRTSADERGWGWDVD